MRSCIATRASNGKQSRFQVMVCFASQNLSFVLLAHCIAMSHRMFRADAGKTRKPLPPSKGAESLLGCRDNPKAAQQMRSLSG